MWWITRVFGPQLYVNTIQFLDEIQKVRDLHTRPQMIMGDFNTIVETADKSNANINRRMIARFHRLLNTLELKKTYLNGYRYTCALMRGRM